MIWLPAFFPHVLGVVITVRMAKKFPEYQWLLAGIGLFLEGEKKATWPPKNYFA